MTAMDDQEGSLFEKALHKWYYLAALDTGLADADAADRAYELITDWRWQQTCAGTFVGVAPEPPRSAHVRET